MRKIESMAGVDGNSHASAPGVNPRCADPIFIHGILPRSGTNFLWDLLVIHTDRTRARTPVNEDCTDRLYAAIGDGALRPSCERRRISIRAAACRSLEPSGHTSPSRRIRGARGRDMNLQAEAFVVDSVAR